MQEFGDDASKLSKAYKAIGCQHMFGVRRVFPKKLRASLICACNSDLWPMVRLSQLSEEETDWLLYCVASISPVTKPADFGTDTKGQTRRNVAQQYRAMMKRNPSRLGQLSEELDNVGTVAMKLGYEPDWLSPELRAQYDHRVDRASRGRPAMPSSPSPALGALLTPSMLPSAADQLHAITDGSHATSAASPPPAAVLPPSVAAEPVVATEITRKKKRVGPVVDTSGQTQAVSWSMPGLKLPSFGAPVPAAAVRDPNTKHSSGVVTPVASSSARHGKEPVAMVWPDARSMDLDEEQAASDEDEPQAKKRVLSIEDESSSQ